MTSMRENEDIACYFITKHSWKGKYKRVFSVGNMGITTYSPNTLEITNQWPYSEFVGIVPNVKAQGTNEFIITIKKGGKKTDTMRFSTDHRADLITEALRYRDNFAETHKHNLKYNAYKHHWSDKRLPTQLEVGPGSLDQVDLTTGKVLCSYDYKDIEAFVQISDYPGGFAVSYGGFGRLHFFASERREEILQKCIEHASAGVGVQLRMPKDTWEFERCQRNKFGKFSDDESLTSLVEFVVQKVSPRHNNEHVRRLLCLTETCLIERDPTTYHIVTLRPLCDIFALVRSQGNPQMFSVEYVKGQVRSYTSTDRDALLASVLDGVRASGNRAVHVKMCVTPRGYRLGPFTVPVDEEVESVHLRFLTQPLVGHTFAENVSRFNVNVAYSGLLHAVTADGLFAENKEKLIYTALAALLTMEGDQDRITGEQLENQFHALRRLAASKAGFAAFTKLPRFREKVGMKVVKALKRKDAGVAHAAIDMINTLMQPMHDDYDLRQEQLNKSSILSSKLFLENLLDIFTTCVVGDRGSLVISAMLDFLTFTLCAPYSETTDGTQFDTLLEMAASHGRCIFRLFQHPSLAIVKGAGMVMKAIIEEGDAEIAAKMQDLALAEGALPRHLHVAMFTLSADSRMLTNRQLSRHLVGLWVTGHPTAMGLMKRIMPGGLLAYLDSTDPVPVTEADLMHVRDNLKLAQDQSKNRKSMIEWKEIEKQVDKVLQHWRSRIGLESKQDPVKPIVLRKRRQRIKSEANWPLFYYHFYQDHAKPNLIWNHKTREELKNALENEMRAFNTDKDLSANCIISWNHSEFEVQYMCLSEEIKIGDYYLRLLLDEEETEETSSIKRSYEFFNDLYHRFLLTPKVRMKSQCLQAMAIVYGRCHEEIGSFNDTKYIVNMLERSTDKLERDRLVLFIHKLTLNRKNVKEIMDANGIRVLVDLLTLAHMHINRATVPTQTNVIEASPDMWRDTEKEWYYSDGHSEQQGPCSIAEMKELHDGGKIHLKSRCWAQGFDVWRPLGMIPQLKWCLAASGTAVMNDSDLATLILNIMIRICEYYPSRDSDGAIVRPLPRAKRLLSEPLCLPHIVQLLLTFDSTLVEKVATLLLLIMQDNPNISRLHLTGVFFFIMMYMGSNVLPLANFLKYTHLKQAFRSDEVNNTNLMQRSILGNILPDAMVCYLENYTAEKFAEIFLGEFDTPEAIWSMEMRRMMIEKIAAHLVDFTPRLQSNNRALYQYCPIPAIHYPQLESELFCNVFYLRHLCDTQLFPDWPIKEPVKLLKDILDAWKLEVEKKPPTMSIDDAYKVLGLKTGVGGHEEMKVRKAYFRLAQKYHPDKNKEGRDMFEQVNKAYEFLCSKAARSAAGPDPQNIVLILQAQSILFSRYKDELHPYKYAGYPMLIKTIHMETQDDTLFSKVAPLLAAACELAFHTVNCSALNAEELRREQGIEHLQEAMCRCTGVLSASSKPTDMAVLVCTSVARCYAVAAQFESCREMIVERPPIIKELCRTLYFKHLTRLCTVSTECVSAFAVDYYLQTHLFQAGVLYHLLLFLFHYDYTLEEGGVCKSDDTNQQAVANNLAKLSIGALSRLGGYHSDGSEALLPENKTVQGALESILTPFLARQLGDDKTQEVLKILNSNTENPYLIWNNATRAELTEYLDTNQREKIRTGECDPSLGTDFIFTVHAKELVIGDIFVRVYNEQPSFVIENAKGFTIDLLDFLGSQAQYLHSLLQLTKSGNLADSNKLDRLRHVEMALEALCNIIQNNPGVEIQCIGHFRLLFSLLRLNGCDRVQTVALEVIVSVTKNQECVGDIAASEILVYLLLLIGSLPQCQLTVIETLYALTSNTKIINEAVQKGGLLYLLDLFCNSTNAAVRERAAELFAKMMMDKLLGPRVRIILAKFLPAIFMDAMRESPQAAAHMFEGVHENPELIWNDNVRRKVMGTVKEMTMRHHLAQMENPDIAWKFQEDMEVLYAEVRGELMLGDVYLRIFISNPGWVLRRVREFTSELLNKFIELCGSKKFDGEMLEVVTQACVCLFSAQPNVCDQVPGLGHIPQIFQAMTSRNGAISKAAIMVTHQLANNETCIRSMAEIDCIGPLKIGMKVRRDMIGLACETINKLFQKDQDELVQQALKVELVSYLLGLLDGGLPEVENPAGTKAQIVKALKAMALSLRFGDQINAILDKSSVWSEYKEQKHDLFISNSTTAGYLTGGPGVAGYLTQGNSRVPTSVPDDPPQP